MTISVSKLAVFASLAGSVGLLAACSGADPGDSAPPPPPPAASYSAPGPVELAGAPPPPPSDGLLGGPTTAPTPVQSGMAPIPNPLDLPPGERHRIYGYKYDRGYAAPAREGAPRRAAASAPASPAARAPASKAVAAAPAAKAAPAQKAAAPADPKAAQLATALAPVAAASTLTVAESIKTGQAGDVVLNLPQNLYALLREQAAKLGLGRAARTTDVTATLSGEGYTITPNGAQTARLKNGEAPSFKWQVTPLPGVSHSDLSAKFDAILRGERTSRTVALGTLEQPGTPPPPEPEKKGFSFPKFNLGGLKLPDYGNINLPGVGETPSRVVIGGGLVLLALILLIAAARRASEAKAAAARRRKFRTMSDYSTPEPEPVYEQPAPAYAEPATVYAQPETVTTYAQPVETTTVYAQAEPQADAPREVEMTDEERKANWPWRKDDAVEKEPEKV
jgi:hypothetical protein